MKRYLPVCLLIVNLIALDVWTGFEVYRYLHPEPTPTPTTVAIFEPTPTVTPIPTVESTPVPKKITVAKETPKTKTRSTSYFQVPGSGSTLLQSWIDVAGSDFYFDPAEHPGLTDVRFEVNMKLTNGNGQAAIRLYDVTHTMGVVNSEVFTSSQTSVLVTSGAVNFWSGRNQYRVQVKSLTSDSAVFESGRLKMTIEN